MKLRLLALSCVLFSLTSCLDIIETFTLNSNSGGTYEVKTDMSNALSMLAMMGGGKDNEKMPEKMDTSFSFRSIVDTVTALTAEEKNALSKVTATVHLDKEKGEMFMLLNMPFKDAAEYNLIQAAFARLDASEKNPMDGIFKGIMGGMGDNPMAAGGDDQVKKGSGPGMPSDNFETLITANSLVRKVKAVAKSDAPKTATDDMPEDLKEMFKVNYSTVVNLPRAVKAHTGAGKLSEDKKQLKLTKKLDLSAGFMPGDFDFTLEY